MNLPNLELRRLYADLIWCWATVCKTVRPLLTISCRLVQPLSSCSDWRAFGHDKHAPKSGGTAVPLSLMGPGAGSPSITMSSGPRPSSVSHQLKWYLDPLYSRFATIDMGLKLVAAVPPFWGSWSQSNTMWPGPRPRPTSVPSGILIRPTVWPQDTNVRGMTDRTEQHRQGRQRSNSIGRTVLQTVAQHHTKSAYRRRSSRLGISSCAL